MTHSFQTLPARDREMQNPALILHQDPALDNDDGEPSVHSVSIGGLSFDTTRAMVRKAGLIERYFVLFCIASGKAWEFLGVLELSPFLTSGSEEIRKHCHCSTMGSWSTPASRCLLLNSRGNGGSHSRFGGQGAKGLQDVRCLWWVEGLGVWGESHLLCRRLMAEKSKLKRRL